MTATAAEWSDARRRPYAPRGAALSLMRCRAREVVLSGPAGTGKTRACLEKLHLAAEKYPGMRALVLRKTRESLTESALVTFEEKVLPERHYVLTGLSRNNRQHYAYANGSLIVLGGMDKASKVMSTEYDLIFVPEATELAEPEWEALTTRLRNGVLPYQQLLADCNPDAPSHWLKLRCDAGRSLMLESRHDDNPAVTPEYLAALDSLTGPRRDRLRYGRWVQAEGVVYEGFDRATHVIDPFEVPPSWPRYLSVDFGYTNPFVCQFWAVDPDGRMHLYREVYRTGRLVEDHARRVKALLGGDWPRAVVCDHDAEDRATLERYLGCSVKPADKAKSPGIQEVAARLRAAGDGKPRLFLFRGAADDRDPALEAARRPCCTAEEFDGYVWDTRAGRKRGEEPLDKDDHGMDALRYAVRHLERPCDGPIFVEPRGKTLVGGMPAGVFGTRRGT